METSPTCNLSIIIINYNTADFLVRCLASIAAQGGVEPEIIVVDNNSRDNTIDILTNQFPWVKLISNKKNLGFSRANNQGLKICKGKYIYFLNPDTEVMSGALHAMLAFMESHPEVGLAGTKISNPDGSPQPSVEHRYPGEKYTKTELMELKGDIAWVLGASMIARRDILKEIEGFDEQFFVYGEEQDLCLRIRKAGWLIGYIPDAVVIHWGGQSERDTLPINLWKKKFEAELILYRKHYLNSTIRSICRANRNQAIWRILTLKLTLPFLKDKETAINKLDRYKLIFQTFNPQKYMQNN